MQDIIVIIGPTGVGKTKLSIELAKKLDAEIINGDSVAIYKELDIASAKPTVEEQENIIHHLLNIKTVEEEYSVFDYQQDVRKKIKEITSRNKRIIIVGGTGLYIKAALYNYIFAEKSVDNTYEELTNEQLYQKLISYDKTPSVHINNRKRIIRLVNKYENKEEITHKKDELLYPAKFIGLTTDRQLLYERINDRVDQMLKNNLLEEITNLKEKYPSSRILNTGIGYKEFYDYLYHEKSLDDVIKEIKQNSRRYAKRQYTFFHHQFPTTWYSVNFEDFSKTIEEIYQDITK